MSLGNHISDFLRSLIILVHNLVTYNFFIIPNTEAVGTFSGPQAIFMVKSSKKFLFLANFCSFCKMLEQEKWGWQRASKRLQNRVRPRFFDQVGHEPCMHLVEISIFSQNLVIVRPTEIMNIADKNWAQFSDIKYLKNQNFQKYFLVKVGLLVEDSSQKFFFGKIQSIVYTEKWLRKSEF